MRQKNSCADLVRHIKQHYKTPAAPAYDAVKVACRTGATYYTDQEVQWQDQYERRRKILLKGFFTEAHQPYRPLGGDMTLEPHELVLQGLADALPEHLVRAEQGQDWHRQDGVSKQGEKPTTDSVACAVPEEKTCQLETRDKVSRSAGMKDIRALLQESEQRIVAVKAGQPYIKHVKMCDEGKRKLRKKLEEEKEEVGMEIQRLSSHYLAQALETAGPLGGKSRKSKVDTAGGRERQRQKSLPLENEDVTKQSKRGRKVEVYIKKMECIYHLLCSVFNLKSKYLKSKTPLSSDVVNSLRKSPFLATSDQRGSPTLKAHSSRGPHYQSNDTINSRFETRQIPTLQSTKENVTSGRSLQTSRLSITRPSIRPDSQDGTTSDNSSNMMRTMFRRKTRYAIENIMKSKEGKAPPAAKLDTWDDLLLAGSSKVMKLFRGKSKAPWTPAPPSHHSADLHKSGKEKEEAVNHMEVFHPETVVSRNQVERMTIRERFTNHVKSEIERLDRERLVNFRSQLEALDNIHPLLEKQADIMLDLSEESGKKSEVVIEENAPWYERLVQEAKNLGCNDNPDVAIFLGQLEIFLKEDPSLLAHPKEKLCLITMSLPIYEVCMPQWQHAIKYILKEVFMLSPDILSQWMQQRKLYTL